MTSEPPAELVPRIGTFFILVGIGLIILFMASDFANQPDFDYLFLGLIGLGIGYLFRRRAARSPASGRFGALRRMRTKKKDPAEK
jgi:hypothetical protein